ncbi:hypothetical protein A4X13_0g8368 [Tilletia indica]|uniref:Uncharacterized protein n=1 Tax=Tilletia indica TaxID=43049 RepID=A0A177TMQ9_9BASI|nr:hypothetical protein A4X13_0g8368 [Tilletia indica]
MPDSSSSDSSDDLPQQQRCPPQQQRCFWTSDEERAFLRLILENKRYQTDLLHLWYPRTEKLTIKRRIKNNQPSRGIVQATLHRVASQLSVEGSHKTSDQVRSKLYCMQQRYRLERSDLKPKARNMLLEELTPGLSSMRQRRRLIRRYHWWEAYHTLVVARERAWQVGAQDISISRETIHSLYADEENEILSDGEDRAISHEPRNEREDVYESDDGHEDGLESQDKDKARGQVVREQVQEGQEDGDDGAVDHTGVEEAGDAEDLMQATGEGAQEQLQEDEEDGDNGVVDQSSLEAAGDVEDLMQVTGEGVGEELQEDQEDGDNGVVDETGVEGAGDAEDMMQAIGEGVQEQLQQDQVDENNSVVDQTGEEAGDAEDLMQAVGEGVQEELHEDQEDRDNGVVDQTGVEEAGDAEDSMQATGEEVQEVPHEDQEDTDNGVVDQTGVEKSGDAEDLMQATEEGVQEQLQEDQGDEDNVMEDENIDVGDEGDGGDVQGDKVDVQIHHDEEEEDGSNQNAFEDAGDAEDVMIQAAKRSPGEDLHGNNEDEDSPMDAGFQQDDDNNDHMTPLPPLTTDSKSVTNDAMDLDSHIIDSAHDGFEIPHADIRAADGYQDQQIAVDAEVPQDAASPEAVAEHIADADRDQEEEAGKSDGNQRDEVVKEGASCLAMVLFRPALPSVCENTINLDSKSIQSGDTGGQLTIVNAASSMSRQQYQDPQAVALRIAAANGYELVLKKNRKSRSSSQETARTKIIERERTRRLKIKLDAQEREREQWLNFVAERMESSLDKKIKLANEELKRSVLQHVEERLQNLGSSSSSTAAAP